MGIKLHRSLQRKLLDWLTYEPPADEVMPYDFNRLRHEIRVGDVLLVEGRSRVSAVIRQLTQSPWTHAALYIGRINDYEDPETQELIRKHLYSDEQVKDNTQLILEDLMDSGSVITPLSSYKNHHLRICRPIGLSPNDLQSVLQFAFKTLGKPYNVKQIIDLARFLLPWSILPRRLGSSLFKTSSGDADSSICSTVIAQAFSSVQFPILPFLKPDEEKGVELFEQNPHIFTPKDFDYSPYFEIIKYPLFNPDEPLPYYRRMPWTKSDFLHHGGGELAALKSKKKKEELPVATQEVPDLENKMDVAEEILKKEEKND